MNGSAARPQRRSTTAAFAVVAASLMFLPAGARAQMTGTTAPPAASTPAAPSLTLDDALAMARLNSPNLSLAAATTAAAHAAKLQARAAVLPSAAYVGGYAFTQPSNAVPQTPRFIAANGVREYLHQADVHTTVGLTEIAAYRSAAAGEDLARAEAEIVSRGLVATVIERFDAVVVARRKQATARQAANDASRFLTITQDRERGGEAAHADVIKAQLEVEQRQRELTDATLALDTSQDNLAILIYPDYNTNFSVEDDLDPPAPLPSFDTVRTQATAHNPDLAAADAAARQAGQDLWAARGQMLPSLGVDYLYGLDAGQLARRTDGADNVGYAVVASVSVPIWTWGATTAEVTAARLKARQAQLERALAGRQLLANLHSVYAEAQASRSELDSLRQSANLAADSLQLTTLRYQAGEATVLEVVDAQATLVTARNAFDDGQARYHLALANLQRLTGTF